MCDEFKLFIRNIPYDCTQEKLENTLQNCVGYKSCSINIDRSDNSRGNGIMIFDSAENGFVFLNENNIFIDDRRIKFMKYINKTKSNMLYVTHIPNGTETETLRHTFEMLYGPIGKCYIKYNYTNDTTSAVVDVKNKDNYYQAINDKIVLYNDDLHSNVELYVKRFIENRVNIKVPSDLDKITKHNVYIDGFNVGRKYGYNECLRQNKMRPLNTL